MATDLIILANLREAHSCALQVGHSGTLDPMATGLLIICTGSGTKSADTFQAMHKEYTGVRAPILFGVKPCFLNDKFMRHTLRVMHRLHIHRWLHD